MYEYRSKVIRVIDGDTIHAQVDLGCDIRLNLTLRLAGINAPELPTPAGLAAKAALEGYLAAGDLVVRTIKDRKEKFGRYLATLFVDGVDVNERLVAAGHAKTYDGGARTVAPI